MLKFVQDNIFEKHHSLMVNFVNCNGVPEDAFSVSLAYFLPFYHEIYRKACMDKTLHTGGLLIVNTKGQTVVSIAVKNRKEDRPDHLAEGLNRFSNWLKNAPEFQSVAVMTPEWANNDSFREMLSNAFEDCPQKISVFSGTSSSMEP